MLCPTAADVSHCTLHKEQGSWVLWVGINTPGLTSVACSVSGLARLLVSHTCKPHHTYTRQAWNFFVVSNTLVI